MIECLPPRPWLGYSLRSLLLLIALLAICLAVIIHFARHPLRPFLVPDFGHQDEWQQHSYDEFLERGGDASFDPIGASDIFYRVHAGRDGYDKWWRMSLSPERFNELLGAVASAKNGPNPISEDEAIAPPTNWKPESSPPSWWNPRGRGAKHFHWCYATGAAERHHGWYFAYDADAEQMWCWHWNHQWSSAECR